MLMELEMLIDNTNIQEEVEYNKVKVQNMDQDTTTILESNKTR